MSNILISNMELPKQGWLKLIILPNGEVRKVDTVNEAVIATESKAVDYPSRWHTGTPTEDGEYLVLWRDAEEEILKKSVLYWNDYLIHWYDDNPGTGWIDEYHAEVIAWRKIEPYTPEQVTGKLNPR